MRYLGMYLEIDLFPKLLDSNGKIWSLTKERGWTNSTSFPHPTEFSLAKELSDVAKASILFIKMWKSQEKKLLISKIEPLKERLKAIQNERDQIQNPVPSKIFFYLHHDVSTASKRKAIILKLNDKIHSIEQQLNPIRSRLRIFEEIKSFHVAICVGKISSDPQEFTRDIVKGIIIKSVLLMICAYKDKEYQLLEGPSKNPLGAEIGDYRDGVCEVLDSFLKNFNASSDQN
jgi:hypothetical protein